MSGDVINLPSESRSSVSRCDADITGLEYKRGLDTPASDVPPTTLSLTRIDFDELFRRHLRRHSEFGINVLHLIAVYGIYLSIYSLVAWLVQLANPVSTPMTMAAVLTVLSIPYLGLVVRNVPRFDAAGTLLSVLILSLAAYWCSQIPVWIHPIAILAWHRFQLWSHRRYTRSLDMSAFDSKYPKGFRLFVLLALYELPILLHYFLIGKKSLEAAEQL